MKDYDWSKTTLYKYRKFDARTLSMLINKEIYFAGPENLNDPYDCQISITEAIWEAISIAKKRHPSSLTLAKLNLLTELADAAPKMEADIKGTGIFSLSRTCRNVLMWAHYADEHRGLCVGFRLSDKFTALRDNSPVVGTEQSGYFPNNPFVNYLVNMGITEELVPWDQFWFRVFSIGLVAKHNSWRYEQEVRIIRNQPGTEWFQPKEIVEIVFGLNMDWDCKKTIIKLLSSSEFAHVKFSKMTKSSGGFRLEKVPLSSAEITLAPFVKNKAR
jgi:hypothetical protein